MPKVEVYVNTEWFVERCEIARALIRRLTTVQDRYKSEVGKNDGFVKVGEVAVPKNLAKNGGDLTEVAKEVWKLILDALDVIASKDTSTLLEVVEP